MNEVKGGNIMEMKMNKKAMTLGDVYPAILTIVLIGIVLGLGLYILTEVDDKIADEEASSAINLTVVGLGDFADWIAIIVIVIAAAIVLGIVFSSFGRGKPGV